MRQTAAGNRHTVAGVVKHAAAHGEICCWRWDMLLWSKCAATNQLLPVTHFSILKSMMAIAKAACAIRTLTLVCSGYMSSGRGYQQNVSMEHHGLLVRSCTDQFTILCSIKFNWCKAQPSPPHSYSTQAFRHSNWVLRHQGLLCGEPGDIVPPNLEVLNMSQDTSLSKFSYKIIHALQPICYFAY